MLSRLVFRALRPATRGLSSLTPINGTETSSMVMQRFQSIEVSPSDSSGPPFDAGLSSFQASEDQLLAWLGTSVGLQPGVAESYAPMLALEGYDSAAALSMATIADLQELRIRKGHARMMLARAGELPDTPVGGGGGGARRGAASGAAGGGGASSQGGGSPPPRLFDYETIISNLSVGDAIEAVEAAFGALAQGKVDVPMPMHIGIDESDIAGPGDCHIKGGYVSATPTWTVKLACVSFYKNAELGLPPGSGIFIVMNAQTGAPLAILQENRFMTDLRTGAAGAVALKHCSFPEHKTICFLGCGAIAEVMARASHAVRPDFRGIACAYTLAEAQAFATKMEAELGVPFVAVAESEKAVGSADVIFTQTPGGETVLEKSWLRPHATIICSGSDQPTKQEIPVDVLAASKYVSDLTNQTARVGELRSAIKAGAMTEGDVHAELGEIVNGSKPGRVGDELIVVDLTGTGAQDAAIGQVAWDKLSSL